MTKKHMDIQVTRTWRSILSIITVLTLWAFSHVVQAADERWSYSVNGQHYESLGAAEAALASNPAYVEFWRDGGNVTHGNRSGYTYTYKAITAYYFANETHLNGIGWAPRGRTGKAPTIDEVITNTLSATASACATYSYLNTAILSLNVTGDYNKVTNEIPVGHVRSQFRDDCSGSEGTTSGNDVIKAEVVTLAISATIQQYCGPTRGNPCDPITGAKKQTEIDYSGVGLSFARYFHSARQAVGAALAPFPMTPGWSHSYSRRVSRSTDARGQQVFTLVRDNGNHVLAEKMDVANRYAAGDWMLTQTGSGNNTEIVLQQQNGSREIYSYMNGQLKRLVSPDGRVTRLNFQGGFLSSVVHPSGRTLLLENNGELITAITLPGGDRILYAYEDAGTELSKRLTTITYADGTKRNYHYEDGRFASLLTGITDESGMRYSTFAYDERGRVVSSYHHDNDDRVDLTYATDGSTLVTDANGNDEIFTVSLSTGFPRVAGTSGFAGSEGFSYSGEDDQMSSYIDKNGNMDQWELIGGRVLSFTESAGSSAARAIRYEYLDNDSALVASTSLYDENDMPVSSIQRLYDDAGRMTSESVHSLVPGELQAARTSRMAYGASNRLVYSDGPRSDVYDRVDYSYYDCNTGAGCGEIETITNGAGHVTRFLEYNTHGFPTRIADPSGVETTLIYDARQRLIKLIVDGNDTTYSYDAKGNPTRVVFADSTTVEYVWSESDRLVSVIDGAGNQSIQTTDPAGHITATTIADSASITRYSETNQIDEAGRVSITQQAEGASTRFEYDGNGNVTAIEDAAGRRTTRRFDALDRLVSEIDPLFGETRYAYDARDNLTSITDPEGKVTTYFYSGLGDLLSQVSPDTGTTIYTVDEAGNRTSQTDARGVTETYTYDVLNRLTSVNFSDSAEDITYTYDLGAHGVGRLSSITDESGSTGYEYDARGNIVVMSSVIGTRNYRIEYVYNGADRLTGAVYPNGRTLSFSYDASGRIAQVTSSHNGVSEVLAAQIERLPFGPMTAMTLGNGLERTRRYDLDYRIQNLADGAVLSRNYGYSNVNNITAITDSIKPALSQLFNYDALDRMEFAVGDYGDQTFAYDGIGNRQSLTLETPTGSETQTYQYTPGSHRLASISGQRSFQYDAAGNTLNNAKASFTYNLRNRMDSATADSVTTSYLHNALGQRVSKSGSDYAIDYLYDLDGHLIAEADSAGVLQVEYAYLDGEPLVMWRESDTPQAPGIVTPIAPLGAITTATPTYEWADLGNAPTYWFLVYDRSESREVHRQAYQAADICTAGTCSLAPSGVSIGFGKNHIWRVRARNIVGFGEWSGHFYFDREEQPPGTTATIVTRIEAEDYDEGGQQVGYYDLNPGNAGGLYRTDDVDIQTTADSGAGYNVGWIGDGEWLAYTVNVPTSGQYDLVFRYAVNNSSGNQRAVLSVGGSTLGEVELPNTDGWQTWSDVTLSDVTLSAGNQRLQLNFFGGATNFNWFELRAAGNEQPPAVTTPTTIRIEAEDYDAGGQQVGYYDLNSGNAGGSYRTDDVDIQTTVDTGEGYNVGWIGDGEWLAYTVNLPTSGQYDLALRYAVNSASVNQRAVLSVDDSILGEVELPSTDGWQTWSVVTLSGVSLSAGNQRLQLKFFGGATNFNWLEIRPAGNEQPPVVTTPTTIRIEAEDYDAGGQQVGYYDLNPGNAGGSYRTDDVDIQTTADAGAGYNVGWIGDGEWLAYTVDVPISGQYDLVLRYAVNNTSGGQRAVLSGGGTTLGDVTLPNTGGWQTWSEVAFSGVTLPAGSQRLQLRFFGGSTNYNWFELRATGTGGQ
jgi:YD repeat-containing protein